MFKVFKPFAWPWDLKKAGILSMNERNYQIIGKNNKRFLYPLVDNKVKTKELAKFHHIKTPALIGIIQAQNEVKDFLKLIKNHKSFVIKPAQGSGGKGVLVIKEYTTDKFITTSNDTLTFQDIYQHISNILSGLYSLGGKYDTALLEEVAHFSNHFKDYSFQGVPDVRIIVYRGYPAMAMIRLATKESKGRANLHQGAVGVGLDIKTGHALSGVQYNKIITHHPDTGADLSEIKVPFWKEHLEIAVKGYEMTGLGYFGADIVLDKEKGPLMLEMNARPGLAIQIANQEGLKKRLNFINKKCPENLSAKERLNFILK